MHSVHCTVLVPHKAVCSCVWLSIMALLFYSVVVLCVAVSSYGQQHSLTLAVWLSEDGQADGLATKYGFINMGQVGDLERVYKFVRNSRDSSFREVQQHHGSTPPDLQHEPAVVMAQVQTPLERSVRVDHPSDPQWTSQWTLMNRGQLGLQFIGRDINVEPVWLQGITGKGVAVAVVDDGVLYTHAELSRTFDHSLSVDVVDEDNDVLPHANGKSGKVDRHGTSCAGVIAMARDNGMCGVGVAHDATLVGIRLLSRQPHTDIMEAASLGHRNQHIHVYSNSWGPHDNGIAMEGPGPLTRAVLEKAAMTGRGGLGSVFVWAAGNGGLEGDSCAADGYVSSIFTIAVGSVDQQGQSAFYEEECSAKMVVVFNHNGVSETTSRPVLQTQVVTTGVAGQCRDDFIGTSASCSLVAGVTALALQANPTLSWRDVQYLLVYTSSREGVGSTEQWRMNGGGLWTSRKHGFGAVDGEALVSRARHWVNVPPQDSCTVHSTWSRNATADQPLLLTITVSEDSTCNVHYLEHVVVRISLSMVGHTSSHSYSDYLLIKNLLGVTYTRDDLDELLQHRDVRRGDVTISLLSPRGSHSVLLPFRRRDFVNTEGFIEWPFMTIHHWGEDPAGEWILNITYDPLTHSHGHVVVKQVSLILYGTRSVPLAVQRIPPSCHEECKGGCASDGPSFCDACLYLRNASTLECIASCSDEFEVHSGYCVDPAVNLTFSYVSPLPLTTPKDAAIYSAHNSNLHNIMIIIFLFLAFTDL